MGYSLEAAAEIYRAALRDAIERYKLLYLSEGALLAVIGVLAIIYPLVSSSAIAVPLGWLLIITAVLQGVVLFGMRSMPHFAFQALSVALALIIGLLLLRDPQQARETLIMLVIVYLLLQGVSRLMFGLSIRPFRHWQWVMGSGVLGILLSLVLLTTLPDAAPWLVGLLVGLDLIGEGAAIAYLAWDTNRQPAKTATE
jgi:uncharacterized membrane protein HdeD (DUF308 family)